MSMQLKMLKVKLNYFKKITIRGGNLDKFASNPIVTHFKSAQINEIEISNGTPGYAMIISGGDETEDLTFNDNIIKNNTSNVARIYTRGKAIGNIGTIESSTLQVNQFNG